MTRVIAPPPPEVFDNVFGLISLVLNADAAAETIVALKDAADEMRKLKADYEVIISQANLAQQAAERAAEDAKPIIEQAQAEQQKAADAMTELAKARAAIDARGAELDSRDLAFAEHEAGVRKSLSEDRAKVDALLADAAANEQASAEMKALLEKKLAILRD